MLASVFGFPLAELVCVDIPTMEFSDSPSFSSSPTEVNVGVKGTNIIIEELSFDGGHRRSGLHGLGRVLRPLAAMKPQLREQAWGSFSRR